MVRLLLISICPDIQSFGPRSISGYLKKYGSGLCTIEHLFLPQNIDENNIRIIREFVNDRFEMIGISVMSNFLIKAKFLTEKIKEVSNVPILWGGIHPTVFPEECLQYCDIVCIGEGEETLLAIIKKMAANKSYKNEKSLAFMEAGKMVLNEVRKPIVNLDVIPPLDYDINDNFIMSGGVIRNMSNEILKSFMGDNFTTITSRGCVYKCSYCCNSVLCNISRDYGKIRRQSPYRLINDLIDFMKNLNFIEHITFDDDDFLSTSIDNIKLFSELYKEKIKLPFYVSGLLPTSVSEEKLQILVNAGLQTVRLGIQSASERINQEIYHRYTSTSKIKESIEIINKFKKNLKLPRYDIILDNPWENVNEKIETIKFVNSLPRPFVLNKFSLTFYPGTALFKKAMEENIIQSVEKDVYEKKYKRVENDFLNFLIYIISIMRIPKFFLSILLHLHKRKLIKRVPVCLFVFLDNIDVLKRNIFLLRKFKFKAFFSVMRFSLKLR